jgi:hypothetical protein
MPAVEVVVLHCEMQQLELPNGGSPPSAIADTLEGLQLPYQEPRIYSTASGRLAPHAGRLDVGDILLVLPPRGDSPAATAALAMLGGAIGHESVLALQLDQLQRSHDALRAEVKALRQQAEERPARGPGFEAAVLGMLGDLREMAGAASAGAGACAEPSATATSSAPAASTVRSFPFLSFPPSPPLPARPAAQRRYYSIARPYGVAIGAATRFSSP